MLPMSLHPATTPALASRPRVSLPRPSTSSSPNGVHIQSRRLPFRSLRSLAPAAAAVEAGEPYVGLGEEEPPVGEADAPAVEESEEVILFSTAPNFSFPYHMINYGCSTPTAAQTSVLFYMEGVQLDSAANALHSVPLKIVRLLIMNLIGRGLYI